MKKLTFLLLGLSLTIACTDDKPNSPDPVSPGVDNVWVLNEGNFQAGNAELGVYNSSENKYSAKVFASTNNRQLGDVLHSATEINGEVFLVLNNSGKIEAVDSKTFESTGAISGLSSPRFIIEVSPFAAYVSDLFSDSIAVVDPATKTINYYINISSTSEEMTLVDGKVFIANPYTSHITVVNVADESVSTINTTFNPTAIGTDKAGKVWVLCGGDVMNNINGALEVIDPATQQVEKTIALSSASYTNKMTFNVSGDSLYFLTGNLYKMAIAATAAPSTPFIDGSNNSFYGLGYHIDHNELWLTDAKDFNQKGEVMIYSGSGKLKSSFTAGIVPNGFWMGN